MARKISGEHHQIKVESNTIEYELIYARRKTLAIHVYPDCRVIVKAPTGLKFPQIEGFILKRAGWVLRHQQKFKQHPGPQFPLRQYTEGESYRVLGQQYHLKLIENHAEDVELLGDTITVNVKNISDTSRIARLLHQWFRDYAQQVFTARLIACFPQVEPFGIKYPQLAIRDMKSRWGSCSGKGKITLNLKLIYVPELLIDYVIIHELCHLKELNHSPAFYGLMQQVLPNWRALRERLNHIALS